MTTNHVSELLEPQEIKKPKNLSSFSRNGFIIRQRFIVLQDKHKSFDRKKAQILRPNKIPVIWFRHFSFSLEGP